MARKETVYVVYLAALVLVVVAVNFLVAAFFLDFIQLSLSLTVASGISIAVQIVSALRGIPQLEVRYIPNSDHELYELYHHKDVPLTDNPPGEPSGNYLLIGLANAGRGTARNCVAVLWIYAKRDFSKPIDNPFPLYWSHDPNSRVAKPPEYYNIAPGDERFLAICHCVKSSGKLHFDDYGQFTSRRQKIASETWFKKLPAFYVKVVAYCENGNSTQEFFKITNGDYENLKMEKHPFPKPA
jgi:hypothetical protein